MADVVIYTTRYCPFCIRAKALLDQLGVNYNEIAVDNDPALRQKMEQICGGYTVPQILINSRPVGGCDDLYDLHFNGELQPLLTN